MDGVDIEREAHIGSFIHDTLECDINGQGIPCRTDRLFAVDLMIHYIQLHGYNVYNEYGEIALKRTYKELKRDNEEVTEDGYEYPDSQDNCTR